MNISSARLSVLLGQTFACVKIVGRANFTSSIDFKTVINELRKKGYAYFVLELSECVLMDSTFLGVLAGVGLQLGAPTTENCSQGIELLNPNARIRELLETLGVIHLFRVEQASMPLLEQTEPCLENVATPTREEVKRACREAHEILMSINPENASRFKDVTQFLAEDVKKLR
jgi:anti-anti-sigma regulatory factor